MNRILKRKNWRVPFSLKLTNSCDISDLTLWVLFFDYRCRHGKSSGQDLSKAGFTSFFPDIEPSGGTELLYVLYMSWK